MLRFKDLHVILRLASTMVDTQPLDEVLGTQKLESRTTGPWGWLVSAPRHLDPILLPLEQDKVGVGRSEETNGQGEKLVIDERLFEAAREKQFLKTSRIHFEVFSDGGLVDMSSNGTYVNGLKVGKNKTYRLSHGDVISLLDPDLKIYSFLCEKHLRLHWPESLASTYLVGRIVGEGASATVYEVFTRGEHTRRALKVLDKNESSRYSVDKDQDLMREVEILKGIKHPCITEILDVVETPDKVMIVMEFAAGGELFEQVVADHEAGKLEERHAKIQCYQMATVLAFLHSRRVCHRDLKLENVLLAAPGPTSRVKVTDFGLSKKWTNTSLLQTFVG